ncbi:MAG TPA: competence/damage-inducible protein A [Chloroflexota bacterium]|jgi:molybdenum cofactor synthesis domain-containing protein
MEVAPSPPLAGETSPVEIFSIGTELLIGRIQDTNSFWLAEQASALGAEIARITIVGDDRAVIVGALREAVARGARTVLTTGGLGPTPDDLTVECVAELAGVGTSVYRPALEDYMRRRLISEEELTPALYRMATVPDGCDVLLNPAGWAPCMRLRHEATTFFLMPGPPKEMQAVFDRYLRAYFGSGSAGHSLARRVYVNMHEGEVAPYARQVMDAVPGTYIKGYIALSNQQRLPLDVVVRGADEAAAQANLERAVSMLTEFVAGAGRQVTG